MLVEAFRTTIFPYMVQVGVILFVYSIVASGYVSLRNFNFQQLWDKIWTSTVAYMIIRGAFVIVDFVDKVVSGFKV